MTMQRTTSAAVAAFKRLRDPSIAVRRARVATVLGLLLAMAVQASAQQPPVHYFHRTDVPPGTIGQGQLLRGGPLPGYFQPVELVAPDGARISLAVEGTFDEPQGHVVLAGLLIGQVYRLRISNIPFHEGAEVFPTIELVNRLYPPPGLETRYPIPIPLTQEELEMALTGRYVERVVYLENPEAALPRREDAEAQRYFDVGPGQDALQVADQLGRPMAILRMGSRTPAIDGTTGRFLFFTPPWIKFAPAPKQPGSPPADRQTLRQPAAAAPTPAEPDRSRLRAKGNE